MRPSPAARIDGSRAWVSATGPRTLVANIFCHSAISVSSTIPAPEIPALCTRAYGAPTASSIALAAAEIDAVSVRSSGTPISRSSSPAPVASRRRGIARSGVRMAATTRHPSRYRRTAEANPSPRDAPVMTTVRGSTMLALRRRSRTRAFARRWRVDVGPTVRLPAHPGRPDAHRERAFGAGLLVISLRVIDFGLWVWPRAGNGRRRSAGLDRREPTTVDKVGHVDDHEHHQKRAEHRTAREDLGFRGQLLRHRLTGVVAVAQDRGRDHHERHRERLPDQRELKCRAGEYRAPRDHLRVDVHAHVDELILQERIEDEADYTGQQAKADQRVPRHESLRPSWPAACAGSRSPGSRG